MEEMACSINNHEGTRLARSFIWRVRKQVTLAGGLFELIELIQLVELIQMARIRRGESGMVGDFWGKTVLLRKIQAVDFHGDTNTTFSQIRSEAQNPPMAVHKTWLAGQSHFLGQNQDTLEFLAHFQTSHLRAEINTLRAHVAGLRDDLGLGTGDFNFDQHLHGKAGHFSPFLLPVLLPVGHKWTFRSFP
jgi:hypothetical protein